MVSNYKLDSEDEKILNELDNLCGVFQNKEVLRDIIYYIKLKEKNELDFGNYNIIVRNDSSYNLLNDLLKVCCKIFLKYNIIENAKVCYLDKIVNNRRDCPFDKIIGIEESIIVVNDRKLGIDYNDELDNLRRILNQFNNKVFIFEDTNFCEGETDGELGKLAPFRMTIDKISLDDKIMYCKNTLDEYNIKYKKQDIKTYADVPFWILKNMVIKLLIECKIKNLDFVDKQMLKKNKEFYSKNKPKKRKEKMIKQKKKNAKDELNELIGLNDIKKQMEKILNYVKLNKERGQMPSNSDLNQALICVPEKELYLPDLIYLALFMFAKELNKEDKYFIHCAIVEKNDKAILISGEPGSGKTTLAMYLCMEKGYNFVCNDRAVIGMEKGIPYIYIVVHCKLILELE